MIDDFSVAEGDTPSGRPSPIVFRRAENCRRKELPKPRRRILRADAERPDTKKGANLVEIDS